MSNSPRPGVWALERSTDHGATWNPWQYFAGNDRECQRFFGVYSYEGRDPKVIRSDDEVSYSFLTRYDYNCAISMGMGSYCN